MTHGWIDHASDLPTCKGAYILWITLAESTALPPRFGDTVLQPGHYLYLGSAHGPGGIRARCARHLKRDKTRHWHVDWLTTRAETTRAFAAPHGSECNLTVSLSKAFNLKAPVKGLGSSDCTHCHAHVLCVPGEIEPNDIAQFIDTLN